MPPKKPSTAPVSIPVKPDALKGKSVIITGDIEGQTRKSAEQILVNAGAKIEKSLNKKVQLVVLGEKAGPQKLEKIEELGIESKDWDDVIAEIKAGDSGENAEDEDINEKVAEEVADEEDEVEEKPKPKGKRSANPKANTKAKADPAPKKTTTTDSSESKPLNGKKVIITGTIPGHDRASAQKVVEENGASVAKSLNKQVQLVILGTNPGPDKLAKIEELGIETKKWADLCEELGIEAAPEKEVADVEAGDPPDSIEGLTVIISGAIDGQDRKSAQKLLESAGATYAKSLNKSVELVILGTNPGPDKLNKIAELGIDTCSFEALVEKLDLEAKQPPKKKAKKN